MVLLSSKIALSDKYYPAANDEVILIDIHSTF